MSNRPSGVKAHATPTGVPLNVGTCKRRVCPQCECPDGSQIWNHYEVPHLMRHKTGGQDTISAYVWQCMNCGHRYGLPEAKLIESLDSLKAKLAEADDADDKE